MALIKDQNTTAGTGGWYNLQDFLKANPQTPDIQNLVQGSANKEVSKGKSTLESEKGALSEIPKAIEYKQPDLETALQNDEYDTLRKNVNQEYNPTAIESQLPNIESSVSQLKPGNTKSILDWFGQAQPTSSTYNPGMQSMDELLLRGSKDFSKNFATNTQNQYKEAVTDPLEAARAARTAEETAAKTNIGNAAQGWKTGVKDWLGTQKKGLEDVLTQQQAKEAEMNKSAGLSGLEQYRAAAGDKAYNDMLAKAIKAYEAGNRAKDFSNATIPEEAKQNLVKDYMGENYGDVTGDKIAQGWQSPDQQAIMNVLSGIGQYGTRTGQTGAPNLSTAAAEKGLDINDYNALLDMSGDTSYGSPLSAGTYNPGSINYNMDEFNKQMQSLLPYYGQF
jgi:hypothetical protein